jgi:hypothetical protein
MLQRATSYSFDGLGCDRERENRSPRTPRQSWSAGSSFERSTALIVLPTRGEQLRYAQRDLRNYLEAEVVSCANGFGSAREERCKGETLGVATSPQAQLDVGLESLNQSISREARFFPAKAKIGSRKTLTMALDRGGAATT